MVKRLRYVPLKKVFVPNLGSRMFFADKAVKIQAQTDKKECLYPLLLDNHVLIDQWMIDFKPERQFYVFPIEPTYQY